MENSLNKINFNNKLIFLLIVIIALLTFAYLFSSNKHEQNTSKPIQDSQTVAVKAIIGGNELNETNTSLRACVTPPKEPDFCELACEPTEEEIKMATIAWQYIKNNYQKKTGLTNAANKYPSAAIWDWAAGVYGMFAAYKFKIIDRVEFDRMFGGFLKGMQSLPLYNNELPNKTYNTKKGYMVDYRNKRKDSGTGWSAADVARFLSSMYMIKSCMPTYEGEVDKLVTNWRFCRVLSRDGDMYGGTFKKGKLNVWHEALTGYEEYLARAFELWDFNATEAKAYKYLEFADVYGIKIPIDTRKFFSNFVGSEPFWFLGMEYGWDDNDTREYSHRMYRVQEERFKRTGILTAVTEDNIDRRPYFLFNTVYTHGEPWKTINQHGEDYDRYKTVSTKAAIGMHYLFGTPYSNLVFNYVKHNYNEKKGYYAGKYEKIPGPNRALTLNTNGVILEAMLYSKMGPLLKRKIYRDNTYWDYYRNKVNNFRCLPSDSNFTVLEPAQATMVSEEDLNAAKIAWKYFKNNYNKETGFVNVVNRYPNATTTSIGNTILATIAAHELEIIKEGDFEKRIERVLKSLKKIKLYSEELPNHFYHAKTLDIVDIANKKLKKGSGWDMYGVAKILTSLYILARDYPQYEKDVFKIVNRFDFERGLKEGKIRNWTFDEHKGKGKLSKIKKPAYEFYVHNALKFFNFSSKSNLLNELYLEYRAPYKHEVPMDYEEKTINAEPYLWTMLEQPYYHKYRHYSSNVFRTLDDRYKTTKKVTTSTEEPLDSKPRYVENFIYDKGILWNTLGRNGKIYPKKRVISTKAAFIYSSLYPDQNFSKVLMEEVKELYNKKEGWYGGLYEKKKKRNSSLNISTNTAVLEAIWYKKVGNFYYRKNPKEFERLTLKALPKGDIYSIVSSSFERRSQVKKIVKKLKDAPFVRIEREDGELDFVLKVGAFKTHDEAKAYHETLQVKIPDATIKKTQMHQRNIMVTNTYINYNYQYPFKNKLEIATNKKFEKVRKAYLKKKKKEDAKRKAKKEKEAKKKREKEKKKKKSSDKKIKNLDLNLTQESNATLEGNTTKKEKEIKKK